MKEYFEKYRSRIVLMGLFVFLIHGAKLFSVNIGIDTEDLIHIQGDFYGGWLNTGRQGLYVLKWLTDSLQFQPYMAGLLTLIGFTAAVSGFFMLWDKVTGETAGMGAWVAGGLFLVSHPIMTEQFYFTLQSVEICIGLLSTVAVLYLLVEYGKGGGFWRLLLGTVLLVLNFSIYQAFVVIFIFGTVSVLFLDTVTKMKKEENITAKGLLAGVFPYLGVFFAAFLINSVITKLFFSVSDYLGGQILWGKFEVIDNFRAIAGHVLKALTGYEGIHYHFSFGLLCIMIAVLTIGLCLRYLRTQKKKSVMAVVLFYLAAVFVSPFLMTLVCGGAPVIRSQLVLPLLTGFLAYLALVLLGKKGCNTEKRTHLLHTGGMVLAVLICVVGIRFQTSMTQSLYYTDEMRYEQDAALGRELIQEIDRVRGRFTLPVAIVGNKPFSGNHACVTGEIIGKSFFDHDVDVEPKYYWSTRRMLGFFHVLGTDYEQAAKEKFADVVNYSKDMPVWPAEGSIQLYDSMVIVKLSETK